MPQIVRERKAGEVIGYNIHQIISKQSTITGAINALKRDVPFMNDEACFHIITALVKEDDDLLLIDDYNTNRVSDSDADINQETEDILATFDESEMKDLYVQTLQTNDDIGVMDWNKIIECVKHEMWPKLGSIMKAILRSNKPNIIEMAGCEVKKDDIEMVVDAFKEKGIASESINYLQKLIERAIQFPNRSGYDIYCENQNQNDFEALLSDIWSVYKWHRFTQSNLTEYPLHQFKRDIIARAHRFKSLLRDKSANIQIKHDNCYLYPQYLIDDHIFDLFKYHFAVSCYVDYLKNTMHIEARAPFTINAVIIPSAVSSVYDPRIAFKCSINEIDQYLVDKKEHGFIVFKFKRDGTHDVATIFKEIQHHTNVMDIELVDASHMLLIIDRRKAHYDLMYVLLRAKQPNFYELSRNYFVSFSYTIRRENKWNVVSAHLHYGIGYKMRFYPELLTSFIPRLFRTPENVLMVDYLKMIHSNGFKHNWCVNLTDIVFDHYFKMFSGVTHVSVNYNRIVLQIGDTAPLLHFRQLMDYQMECARIDRNDIHQMNAFLDHNGYETDSILVDVAGGFNIKRHLGSNGKEDQFTLIKQLTTTHEGPAESDKVCGKHSIKAPAYCGYIGEIINALKEFKGSAKVSLGLFELESARDHIISYYGYLNKAGDDNARQYIMDKAGECTTPHCQVLERHIMRRRENDNDKKATEEAEDGLKEMLTATLNALHVHCLHNKQELYRLKRDTQQNHFITTMIDNHKAKETKDNPLGSINFGVSVLNWFELGEEPEEVSLRIAIVTNPESTISHQLYLTYTRECYLRLLKPQFKEAQWLLDEIIAVKCYTDTNI